MRTAIVADIHGNLTAFEAVLEDLKATAPDVILHGGDLADGGPGGAEIVDRIRDLGWQGVVGNTDEMLFRPDALTEFASHSPQLQSLWTAVEEMATATRQALGQERVDWLSKLPRRQVHGGIALVHASPEDLWRAPGYTASGPELESAYGVLGQPVAVYGHIHRAYVRRVGEMQVANTGSVGLSHDGDRRAAYLVVDESKGELAVSIQRVVYDVEKAIQAVRVCRFPHADWIAKTLTSASPQLP